MKLKENLANEYVKSLIPEMTVEPDHQHNADILRIFIEGMYLRIYISAFETARAMAMSALHNSDCDPTGHGYYLISQIGEEEV